MERGFEEGGHSTLDCGRMETLETLGKESRYPIERYVILKD